MKLSELKPCLNCGGKVAPIFFQITLTRHLIDGVKTNQVLGLNRYFGGVLGLAEAMAPSDDVTVEIDSHDAFLCTECFMQSSILTNLFSSLLENNDE